MKEGMVLATNQVLPFMSSTEWWKKKFESNWLKQPTRTVFTFDNDEAQHIINLI